MTINKKIIQRTIPVLQKIVEGKTIQKNEGAVWKDIDIDGEGIDISMLIESPYLYRIKPEVKYRSFKNAEECWQTMLKHKPFGWIKCADGYFNIGYVNDTYVGLADPDGSEIMLNLKSSYQDNTFVDGTPFGVKVEE